MQIYSWEAKLDGGANRDQQLSAGVAWRNAEDRDPMTRTWFSRAIRA